MVLGIPVINQHALTKECIDALVATVRDIAEVGENFHVVLIDNGSKEPYTQEELDSWNTPFSLHLLRNPENVGYYYPLLQLYEHYADTVIALMHNDVFIYEQQWQTRVMQAFAADQQLGLVGFVGSYQADAAGGRGGGTMMNFAGIKGQKQAGELLTGLRASLLLDSVFMAFRREVIPLLKIDEHIAPCHFYDKIWPMRVIENNFRVATLGIRIDHMGGMTAIAEPQYAEEAQKWCEKENLPIINNDPGLTVYVEAERRFLTEYRDEKKLFPAVISSSYEITLSL